ncbi:alpha-D-ribose 1-methylphosphonate 5-phosphate C-P-lyase PhnJ, partial [Escherichia coli]|nr:alpha-D-ribose 1-methylphosphonate 5-phosphate C-P-lyase PhnJ [Escherichia coli]
GTGGIQLTASVIGESDVLKVIDQGADDTTNAVSIRNFFKRVTGVNTTERTDDATVTALLLIGDPKQASFIEESLKGHSTDVLYSVQ